MHLGGCAGVPIRFGVSSLLNEEVELSPLLGAGQAGSLDSSSLSLWSFSSPLHRLFVGDVSQACVAERCIEGNAADVGLR